uniref:Uncharacterized protein n=1 Tax=Tanacetum cinerariifolium TaxID=118510 RepID=A0A6L2MBD3_TANCI|nr:hypothetical protein [Tanacetum cinerariifolium]
MRIEESTDHPNIVYKIRFWPFSAMNRMRIFHRAQQVIPAAQLVLRFHTIGRCNNYMVLQSIPCSLECKIIGTVIKVPSLEETSKFMLNTQQFVYTMDMFRDILQLRVETTKNLFLAPVNIETIELFMNKVGYQGAVDKKDEEIEKEKNNDNVEETDKFVKEKDIVDDVTGSTENKKKKKQTPILSPTRSPRNVSSSDKTVSKELTTTVSPPTAITFEASTTTKRKKQSISSRSKTLPGSIAGMCKRRGLIRSHIKNKFVTHDFFMSKIHEVLDHCNKVVPDTTFEKTKAIIT